MSERITPHKLVSIAYTIRDSRGDIVEHSELPISYIHGLNDEQLFPKIERALDGLSVDEHAEVHLLASEAFGERDPDLTFTDQIENAPEELRFVGAELDAESDNGEVLHFRVTHINGDEITIDANHPLAGEDVTFVLRVTEVRDPTLEEISEIGDTVVH